MDRLELYGATSTELSALKPGDVFVYDASDKYRLAIALEREADSLLWLNLSGDSAFQLGAHPQKKRMRVLCLGVDPTKLKLHIDPSSTATNYAEHRPGQLLFGENQTASIAAVWPEFAKENYRNVALIGPWSQSRESEPRFIFDRWSLRYIDSAGQWVDLLNRSPLGT